MNSRAFSQLKRYVQETLGLTVLFVMGFMVVAAASAWSGPSGDPSAGQMSPPLNVGTQTQIKAGDIGATSLVAEQICLPDGCRTAWPHNLPSCRICVRAGVGNGTYGSEQCVAFNGGEAYSARESSSSMAGRGTTIDVRVLCP
jgi:hypothetical protein